ncbi:hypothetical protein ID866_9168 [Astraeus odoratus]|nr:hypothetical protein ID866_9168 [Astraeus odoratus]
MNTATRTFTEVDIYDEEICEDVEYFSGFLWDELKYEIQKRGLQDFLDAGNVQLVVEPCADAQGVLCCYYFVNPAGRSLFWLEEFESQGLFYGLKGVETLSHKGEPHIIC